jgi:hypothetical protein
MDGEGEEFSPDTRLVYNSSLQYKGSYLKGKRDGFGIYFYENVRDIFFVEENIFETKILIC